MVPWPSSSPFCIACQNFQQVVKLPACSWCLSSICQTDWILFLRRAHKQKRKMQRLMLLYVNHGQFRDNVRLSQQETHLPSVRCWSKSSADCSWRCLSAAKYVGKASLPVSVSPLDGGRMVQRSGGLLCHVFPVLLNVCRLPVPPFGGDCSTTRLAAFLA